MILFENITWRNFLSTGNTPITIQFDKSTTTLIVGSNGAGKSTVLDALCFVLYGKSFRRINKAQLINTTNEKGCLVEIVFSLHNTQWKIERGIKPNIFKITRDGKELDQSASAIDQQKWLEQNVLKMNYKSFTQIVILGSSAFVPFMQLPVGSRREVVEDLLDIKIFSSMNMIIKEKIRGLKETTRTLELKKESLKDKVEMQKNFIDEINKLSDESIKGYQKKIDKLQKEVEGDLTTSASLSESLENKQIEMKEFEDASKKLNEMGNLKGKLSQRIQTIVKEHKFFTENRVCPTCNQDIEEDFRVNRITDSHDKAKELQTGFTELQIAIKEEELRESTFFTLSKEASNLINDITQTNTKIAGNQKQIRQYESEIQRVTDQLESRNTEYEKLETFRDTLQTTFQEIGEKKEGISYHDYVYSLLKDGGVKSLIIKKYLPLINQMVNKYLQLMDFYINFKLDEEFNETVESPIHEDFSYSSFSEGEKSRIDLALLFTWREIARFKNSVNTNLMILDEVFDSSLDSVGSDEFTKIIKYVVKDANVFVISHKTSMEEKFDETIKFQKVKGFSSICKDT
jgi:DNA repair exonuclease SbcCD ATPase subunit